MYISYHTILFSEILFMHMDRIYPLILSPWMQNLLFDGMTGGLDWRHMPAVCSLIREFVKQGAKSDCCLLCGR